MTKVLFDDAADNGVGALEPRGVNETAGGGTGACGSRVVDEVGEADGPPNNDGKPLGTAFVFVFAFMFAIGVEGWAMMVAGVRFGGCAPYLFRRHQHNIRSHFVSRLWSDGTRVC